MSQSKQYEDTHVKSYWPVDPAYVAEQSRELRSSRPEVFYQVGTPKSQVVANQPLSAHKDFTSKIVTPDESIEESDEEEEEEVFQEPIIPILNPNLPIVQQIPIPPLQINFDQPIEEEILFNMAEDRTLLPSPFRGTAEEDASEWWRRLDNYNTFKGNDAAAKLRLAKALFVEGACDWLEGLEDNKKDTYQNLEAAFKSRYVQPTVLKFRSAYELFGKKQRTDESVDAYVNRLNSLSKKVDVDDKSVLYALVSGLRAPIASYVLGRNPATLAEAVDAARLAEFSSEEVNACDQVLSAQMLEMRKDIQKLTQRYDSMSTAAAIQSDRRRSPTPPPKIFRRNVCG